MSLTFDVQLHIGVGEPGAPTHSSIAMPAKNFERVVLPIGPGELVTALNALPMQSKQNKRMALLYLLTLTDTANPRPKRFNWQRVLGMTQATFNMKSTSEKKVREYTINNIFPIPIPIPNPIPIYRKFL